MRYVGETPTSGATLIQSVEGPAALLLAGYVPIGLLESTAKLDNDSAAPLRHAASHYAGERFTMMQENLRGDGELRLTGALCEARGSAQAGMETVGGSAGIALSVADVGVVVGGGGRCVSVRKIDQTSWTPITVSRAMVWERRPEPAWGGDAAYWALRVALLEERSAAAIERFGDTFFELALGRADGVSLGRLVSAGYSPSPEQRQQLRPVLAGAIEADDPLAVAALASVGIDPDPTALHTAIDAGLHGVVVALLRAGVKPDGRDDQGRTPLHVAAGHGDYPTVRALVEAGSSLNATDGAGRTALGLAAQRRHSLMVRYLLGKKAKPNLGPKGAPTPVASLVAACACSAADAVIAAGGRGSGCDAERRDRSVAGARTLIAEMQRIMALPKPAARFSTPLDPSLLDDCVDLDAGPDGVTPRATAEGLRRDDWLVELLGRGVNLDDLAAAPPAFYVSVAMQRRSLDILHTALQHGLDPNEGPGDPGLVAACRTFPIYAGLPTAQAAAGRAVAMAVMEMLLAAGADPNVQANGQTPLQLVASDADATALLRAHGAR